MRAEPGRRLRPVREMALIARTGRPAATFGFGRKQAALWSDPSLILHHSSIGLPRASGGIAAWTSLVKFNVSPVFRRRLWDWRPNREYG